MSEPGLPLTTGEGNTARKIRHVLCNCECRHAQTGYEALAELDALLAECGRLREREQAAHGEGYDQGVEDVWGAPVCSVCGADHDADESAMCERGEVVSFREWVDAARRLREQLDAARQALKAICESTDSGPWIVEYRAAGGGYEGLQAIARAALGVEGQQA